MEEKAKYEGEDLSFLRSRAKEPRVSIGLPVYNAQRFLDATLKCLLSQSFRNFELIICDNCSTDRTEEMCRSYSKQDERIRYHRNPVNIGVSRNFNLAFSLAKGEYFKWAAVGDLCAPEFIERCIAVLEKETNVVLCYPKTCLIDENGALIGDYDDKLNLQYDSPSKRFGMVLRNIDLVNVQYGLIRSNALRSTRLEKPYPNSDYVLIAELALAGPFVELPEKLFFRRMFEISAHKYPSAHARMAIYDPNVVGELSFPYYRLLMDFLIAIYRSSIGFTERLRCYPHMRVWLRRWRSGLRQDVKVAAKYLLGHIGITRHWMSFR